MEPTEPQGLIKIRNDLDAHVVPRKYRLVLEPVVGKSVKGKVQIDVDVLEAKQSFIKLHGLGIELHSASLLINSEIWPLITQAHNEDHEVFILEFGRTIPVIRGATLSLEFTSPIYREKPRAIFELELLGNIPDSVAEKYTEPFGFATHFEPTDCRRVFPCFDEPCFRAEFQLTLLVNKNLTAISNTPIISEELTHETFFTHEPSSANDSANDSAKSEEQIAPIEKKKIVFDWTPSMCTYLLCFIAGYFEYLERNISFKYTNYEGQEVEDNYPLRVYTPPGRVEDGTWVMDMAEKAVKFYSTHLKVGFPLKKLDIVGLNDIDCLGMENWGCLFFLNPYFLVADDTPFDRKQRIARLVFHEVGHQWFGNLVAISEWQYLYLKEGFARYIEYYLVRHFFPEWHYDQHFLTEIYSVALKLDEGPESHPIQMFVPRSRDIHDIFDSISYGKAASCIRMLASYIGEDKLFLALQSFMNRNKFGNVTTEDLWQALSEISGQDIPSFMNCWIKNGGHPVLTVTKKFDEKNQKMTLEVSQDVMRKNSSTHIRDVPLDQNEQVSYDLILMVKSQRSAAQTEIINKNRFELVFDAHSARDWIKLNWGHTGVYRVNYSEEMWRELLAANEAGEIPEMDGLGLLLDAIEFNSQGLLSTATLLDLYASFKNSKSYYCWQLILKKLSELYFSVLTTDTIEPFKRFMNGVIKPWSKYLGWFEKNSIYPDLQIKTLQMLSWTADEELTQVSKLIFTENFVTPKNSNNNGDSEELPVKNDRYMKFPNLEQLQIAMNMTLKQGGEEEFKLLMEIFETDPDMASSCYEAILHVPVDHLVHELILTCLEVGFAPNLHGFSSILPRFTNMVQTIIQELDAPETAAKLDKDAQANRKILVHEARKLRNRIEFIAKRLLALPAAAEVHQYFLEK